MLLKRFMKIDDGTGHLKHYISDMLSNNYIYIWDPNLMNDFFEGKTNIKGLSDIEKINTIKELEKKSIKIGLKDKNLFKKNVFDFSKNFRISCFFNDDSDNNDELMWAHYGDNNKGICVLYDGEKLINCLKEKFQGNQIEIYYKKINDNFTYDEQIDYASNITIVNIKYGMKIPLRFKNGKVEGEFNTVTNLFIKSKAWEHEKEVRLLVYKNSSFNSNNYYLKLNRQCIKEIRFGYYCNENLVNDICSKFSNSDSIKFTKMDIDDFGERLVPVHYSFDKNYDRNKINYGRPIRDRFSLHMFKFETETVKDKMVYIEKLLKHINERRNFLDDTGYKVDYGNIIEIMEMWIKYLSLFGLSRNEILNKLNKKYIEEGGFNENYVLKKIIIDKKI